MTELGIWNVLCVKMEKNSEKNIYLLLYMNFAQFLNYVASHPQKKKYENLAHFPKLYFKKKIYPIPSTS